MRALPIRSAPEPRAVGWGFVGTGTAAARRMATVVRAQPGHSVVAACVDDPEQAASLSASLDLHVVHEHAKSLLNDPQVSVVYLGDGAASPYDLVRLAVSTGRHVLCERPPTQVVNEARDLTRASREAGVLLATNQPLRHAATHRVIREVVRAGAIGEPMFGRVVHAVNRPPGPQHSWSGATASDNDPIFDATVQDLDTLRFILGSEPVEAIGMRQFVPQPGRRLDHGLMAVLRFDNGMFVQMHETYDVAHGGTGIEFHGNLGSVFGRDVMTQRPVGDVILRSVYGERMVPLEHQDLQACGVEAFCEALRGRPGRIAAAEDGVRSLAAAHAVHEACRSGQAVGIGRPASMAA